MMNKVVVKQIGESQQVRIDDWPTINISNRAMTVINPEFIIIVKWHYSQNAVDVFTYNDKDIYEKAVLDFLMYDETGEASILWRSHYEP